MDEDGSIRLEEASDMISMLTEKEVAAIRGLEKPQIETEGSRMSLQLFLSELPGIVFGIVTIIWIVGTLGLLNR
jgi:hypothetical protein